MSDKPNKKPNPLLKKLRDQITILWEKSEDRINREIEAHSGKTIKLDVKTDLDRSGRSPKVYTELSWIETGYEDSAKVRRKVTLAIGGEGENEGQETLFETDGKEEKPKTVKQLNSALKAASRNGKPAKAPRVRKSRAKKKEADPITEAERENTPA